MKHYLFIAVLSGFLITACADKENEKPANQDLSTELTTQNHVATIEEKIDAGGYSYLKVSENNNSYWIAVPKANFTIGEVINFSQFMEMKNFKSETLDRTFESVLFVEDATTGTNRNMPNPHEIELSSIQKENVNIQKADGGYTIEELYSKKNELVNKKVNVQGKVVKANLGIMNRNWFHIQDGTGEKGSHDLTIISEDVAKVGDIILVTGTLIMDKDFGSGYFYPLVLENASLTVK
jgi:sporulation protein YlmC with PRC-barrel domain